MNDILIDIVVTVAMWVGIAVTLIVISSVISKKDQNQTNNENDNKYILLKEKEYQQDKNNLEPVVDKVVDLVADSFKRDKTATEFMQGALQGDFSTRKIDKTKVGVALAAGMFAAVASTAKATETTSRAGVEKQFDFGKRKLENEINITSEDGTSKEKTTIMQTQHTPMAVLPNITHSWTENHAFSWSENNIKTFLTVREIVVEQLLVDAEDVKLDSVFVDDLGADDLDMLELIMALEEEFNIEITDRAAEMINTVEDVINYISVTAKQ